MYQVLASGNTENEFWYELTEYETEDEAYEYAENCVESYESEYGCSAKTGNQFKYDLYYFGDIVGFIDIIEKEKN